MQFCPLPPPSDRGCDDGVGGGGDGVRGGGGCGRVEIVSAP